MTDQTSTIPKGWKMTTLGEVADVNSSTIDKNYTFNEIEYIDVASVEERKLTETQKLKLENAPSRAKRIVLDNSVLISTVRPNLKHYCFIKKAKPNLVASTGFAVVNSKEGKSDPYYLYNLLTTNEYTNYLIKIADSQTSTYPAFNPSIIQNSKFIFPSFPEQRAIAAVLSSLDDKIELLREQNKTLEAIAQAIFKEWFLNFNFPDATGKMIDSELGKIPQGWREGRISDLIDILSGFAFSSSDFSQDGKYKLVTIKNVQDRYFDSKTKDKLAELPERMPDYCRLDSGDILLSLTGNVGRICLVNGEDYLLNQRVAKLRAKNPADYAFSYLLFLQDSIFSLLQSTASGTAQQNLSPIQTKEIEIIIAERKTLDQFGAVANKLIQKINDNLSQIHTLSALRDTLLPKLMKGEVRVRGFND
ncbi:MAG: restriction endonuclease subunit S [Bacteroidota bacterium]